MKAICFYILVSLFFYLFMIYYKFFAEKKKVQIFGFFNRNSKLLIFIFLYFLIPNGNQILPKQIIQHLTQPKLMVGVGMLLTNDRGELISCSAKALQGPNNSKKAEAIATREALGYCSNISLM